MGAMKDLLMDCAEHGFVPVNPASLEVWSQRLPADVLDGMPLTHYVENRWGELVPVEVLPISVARRVGKLLPETHDELGWLIECFEETST
jgi:hypothetical protein